MQELLRATDSALSKEHHSHLRSSNPKQKNKNKDPKFLSLSPNSIHINIVRGMCNPVILLMGFCPKAWNTSSQRASCMLMFTALSFMAPKAGIIQATTGTCMGGRKEWAVHTQEYSNLKRKEIPAHVTTYMNFEGILVNEINQSKRRAW